MAWDLNGYSQDDFTADTVNDDAVNDSKLEAQRKDDAEAAGVKDARFIGYAEVLSVYNSRSDTEPLEDRRAREVASTPGAQSFTRAADYNGNAVSKETKGEEWTEDDHTPTP